MVYYQLSLYVYSIGSEYIVNPMGFSECSLADEQHEGQLFYRRIFKNPLTFTNNGDWGYFKDAYDAGNYCDKFDLIIEKRCADTEAWVIDWYGSFSLMNGKFDFDRCTYTVTPTVTDKYTCILNNWEKKINILSIGINKTPIVCNAMSNLEFQFKYNWQTEIALLQKMTIFRAQNLTCVDDTPPIYAREAVLLTRGITPAGTGWEQWNENDISISSYGANQTFHLLTPNDSQIKWVRVWTYGFSAPSTEDILRVNLGGYHPILQDILDSCTYGTSASDYERIASIPIYPDGSSPNTIYEFYKLKTMPITDITDETFNYLALPLTNIITGVLNNSCTQTAYTLSSDFLTAVTNPVTGIASKTNNLYIIQKSDAKRPYASNPATKGEITFKELMDSLYNIFQLKWDIDGNNLIIKHESEISNTSGLNLSNYPTASHKLGVDFDPDKIYSSEQWAFMEANGSDFIGLPIEYSNGCIMNTKVKDYNVSLITTDLAYIQTGGDNVSDEGFALLAANGSNTVIIETGSISNESQINGHLSIANLHYNYWRHNRILITGTMNGNSETFITAQKIKKFNEVSIILPCGTDWDPEDLITTELGNGRVESAELELNTNVLTLNLLL